MKKISIKQYYDIIDLGHLHVQAIKALQLNNMVSGLPKECFSMVDICKGCFLAKCHNICFQFSITNANIDYNLYIVTYVDPSLQTP